MKFFTTYRGVYNFDLDPVPPPQLRTHRVRGYRCLSLPMKPLAQPGLWDLSLSMRCLILGKLQLYEGPKPYVASVYERPQSIEAVCLTMNCPSMKSLAIVLNQALFTNRRRWVYNFIGPPPAFHPSLGPIESEPLEKLGYGPWSMPSLYGIAWGAIAYGASFL